MGRGRESVAREGEEGQDSRGEAKGDREGDGSRLRREQEEQEPPERLQQGVDDGRPKRKRARGREWRAWSSGKTGDSVWSAQSVWGVEDVCGDGGGDDRKEGSHGA